MSVAWVRACGRLCSGASTTNMSVVIPSKKTLPSSSACKPPIVPRGRGRLHGPFPSSMGNADWSNFLQILSRSSAGDHSCSELMSVCHTHTSLWLEKTRPAYSADYTVCSMFSAFVSCHPCRGELTWSHCCFRNLSLLFL